MKKFLIALFCLVCSMQTYASPIQNIYFFGDSLTDNGNLYSSLFHIIPKSPPYFQGRFSNGFVWAEEVAEHYSHSENYAVGGATVIFRNPFSGFLPYTFKNEVDSFFRNSHIDKRKDALYVVWLGGNDYLNGQKDVEASTQEVVNEIENQILRLISNGAENFLIFNLPDLSKAPYSKTVDFDENLHELALSHNKKLAEKITLLRNNYPHVKFVLFDAYEAYDDVDNHPDKFNKIYHTHLINMTDSCWKGGYTVKRVENEKSLLQSLSPLKNAEGKILSYDEKVKLAHEILNNPSLAEAYRVGQAQVIPCEHPDEYAFWDKVHPTATMHLIFGHLILDAINQSSFDR